MNHHDHHQPDFGAGQKKLSIYLFGTITCALLTLLAFWAVISERFARWETFTIIFAAAIVQFFVQLICFLRMNTQTEQSRTNVMSFIFTGVILTTIMLGSLWIMSNLNYNMMH